MILILKATVNDFHLVIQTIIFAVKNANHGVSSNSLQGILFNAKAWKHLAMASSNLRWRLGANCSLRLHLGRDDLLSVTKHTHSTSTSHLSDGTLDRTTASGSQWRS